MKNVESSPNLDEGARHRGTHESTTPDLNSALILPSVHALGTALFTKLGMSGALPMAKQSHGRRKRAGGMESWVTGKTGASQGMGVPHESHES